MLATLRIQLTRSSHQEQRACHGCHGSRCQKRSASKMFMGIQRAKHPGNNQERIMFPECSKNIISGELFFIVHSLWFGVPSFGLPLPPSLLLKLPCLLVTHLAVFGHGQNLLVVSTHQKNASQMGLSSQSHFAGTSKRICHQYLSR